MADIDEAQVEYAAYFDEGYQAGCAEAAIEMDKKVDRIRGKLDALETAIKSLQTELKDL